MNTQGLLPSPGTPPRRKHSLQFKEQVVAASHAPETSVASVAQRFNINANLVHKWRRQLEAKAADGGDNFIKVPLPVRSISSNTPPHDASVKVEFTSGSLGPVSIHWPMSQLPQLASWLASLS